MYIYTFTENTDLVDHFPNSGAAQLKVKTKYICNILTFLFVPQVHEYLRSKLCSLYENDCIFDKFECCWNGSDR